MGVPNLICDHEREKNQEEKGKCQEKFQGPGDSCAFQCHAGFKKKKKAQENRIEKNHRKEGFDKMIDKTKLHT